MKNCPNCGNQVNEGSEFCSYCGSKLNQTVEVKQETVNQNGPQVQAQQTNQNYQNPQVTNGEQKSKLAAGLLGIFLGGLGIHNFYLGYTGKAIGQLCLTVFGWIICIGPVAAEIWGLVEGIMILTGSINKDANGVPLKD